MSCPIIMGRYWTMSGIPVCHVDVRLRAHAMSLEEELGDLIR
jgi:hypothetical protein